MSKLSDTIVRHFFRFQDELKLYHWKTQQYARHKATDKLFSNLQELIDLFIESYMGLYGRVSLQKKTLEIRTWTDKNATKYLKEMIEYLHSLEQPLQKESSLLNIRDEMVSEIYKTLYLFTLE